MTKTSLFACALGALSLSLAACESEQPAAPENTESSATETETAEAAETAGPVQTQTESPAKDVACATIGKDGFCGIEFGMTSDDAQAAWQGGGPLFGWDDANEYCYYLRAAEDNYDRTFMVNEGQVERFDIMDPDLTLNGVGIGTSLDEAEQVFDETERSPNKYMFPAEDLKADLGDGVYAIFEEDEEGNIYAWRLGIEPGIDFVEGCA